MVVSTVYENVDEDVNVQGQLFAGKKFWVAQRCPMRNTFLDEIRNNGGEVVKLEKQADYLIADHFRRDCPPGSISYTFIQQSVKKAELQDPEQHRAGPPVGTARGAGSSSRPAKGGRAAYTPDEDRILYKWVHDCEAQGGGLASGNEIYKQLEAKHPRHTWQSWRDRYLKQLRDRPPSAFSIPDNAPPSPPSDEPAEPPPALEQEKKDVPRKEEASSKMDSGPGKSGTKDNCTVDDLDSLFIREDWEELYAFAEEIQSCSREKYMEGWKSWAEEKTQTAEQWRQYFEKVVLPQWKRDPVSKHEKVRNEVEKRLQESASQKESQAMQPSVNVGQKETVEPEAGQSTPKQKDERKWSQSEDLRFDHYLKERHKGKDSSAYVFYAQERKWSVWNDAPGLDYTGLHKLLMTQWESLAAEEKAHYFALEAAERSNNEGETARKSPQVWLSSSTLVHETPKHITEAYEKARKRIQEGNYAEEVEREHLETTRPSKRRKSESVSPELQESIEDVPVGAMQLQPLEISSDSSSTTESQLPKDGDLEDVAQPQDISVAEPLGSDLGIDGLEALALPKNLELDSSDYPSNTPTPRAPRHKAPAFDTQAILSPPSHGFSLEALPLPSQFTQGIEEDELPEQSPLSYPKSPIREPESEASTSRSLQEFRCSLNTEEDDPLQSLAPLPQPLRSSPPPSSPSSAASLDPDPPLEPSEFDHFFDEQHAAGYTDDYISAALKHTRFRPDLAIEVLAAWTEGKPLPNMRGVWSEEDDEDVESGDGVALARLQRKHTCDGWGGITERMRFLECYRQRKGLQSKDEDAVERYPVML